MNPTWLRALALVCIFAAVVLAVETIVRWMASSRATERAINLRLTMIGRGHSRGDTMTLLKRSTSVIPQGLPPLLHGLGLKFEHMLMQAQLTVPTSRLMLLIIITPLALLFGILGLMSIGGAGISFGRLLIVATFSLLVGAVIPIMALNFKATRMRRRMQEQFPVALDVFVRGLRAGHPIAAALDLLTVELPDPIGTQFGLVVDEVTYGAELRDALQNMADRWDLDDMRMFVVSLSVQSETGGNLAEILENLSQVIRERQGMMMKVRALSSEGRMTAIMLSALPIFAFVMLFIFSPSFFLDVANDRAFIPGFAFLIGLYIVGFVLIRRMIDLKV